MTYHQYQKYTRIKKRRLCTGIIVFYLFIIVAASNAQSLMQSWSKDPQIGVEWYKPSFAGSEYTTMTGIGFFSMDIPVNTGLRIKADIPFGYYSTRLYQNDSKFSIFNPYIGIEHNIHNSPLAVDFGVRLGLSDNSLFFINENSNYYRFYAAIPKTWILRANLHYLKHLPMGFSYQFLFGSYVTLPPNKGYGKSEWYLNYGVHTRYQYQQLLVGAGIKGISILTNAFVIASNGTTTKKYRFSHQFYFEIGSTLQNWTPTIYMAFPFDDYISGTSQLNYILGFRLNIHLPVNPNG
ncbi:MAG TPA: hypothetical protein VKA34_03570 [Balneolales bacterium]|nr:hypothetical protein [Balneolales bacterium]